MQDAVEIGIRQDGLSEPRGSRKTAALPGYRTHQPNGLEIRIDPARRLRRPGQHMSTHGRITHSGETTSHSVRDVVLDFAAPRWRLSRRLRVRSMIRR